MLNKTTGFRGINGKPLAGKLVKNSITASWPKREEVIWKDVARFYAAIRSANFLGSIVRWYGIGMEFRSFDKKIEFRSEGISFSNRRMCKMKGEKKRTEHEKNYASLLHRKKISNWRKCRACKKNA